ncbi:MAG: hypothetical protein IJ348_03175 [Alistipes sp.]|nr:hypothetical protein [Alistipes sp.]
MKISIKQQTYLVPSVRRISVVFERGFSESSPEGFEQPEYGGEDNV